MSIEHGPHSVAAGQLYICRVTATQSPLTTTTTAQTQLLPSATMQHPHFLAITLHDITFMSSSKAKHYCESLVAIGMRDTFLLSLLYVIITLCFYMQNVDEVLCTHKFITPKCQQLAQTSIYNTNICPSMSCNKFPT